MLRVIIHRCDDSCAVLNHSSRGINSSPCSTLFASHRRGCPSDLFVLPSISFRRLSLSLILPAYLPVHRVRLIYAAQSSKVTEIIEESLLDSLLHFCPSAILFRLDRIKALKPYLRKTPLAVPVSRSPCYGWEVENNSLLLCVTVR